ncbi:glycosyltransferase family 2 protein [Longispora albida]|uniref:glycosyltransferase family 2 protein n=1 Tax=Longispora albida TaxID=203523 RepID=UPI001FE23DDC|nr:glycosyltransferase family 2 protein [Longispora albida]
MTRRRNTSNGQSPSISLVVPALNEERNLSYVFGRLPEGITEVILVDGGSKDRTVEVARELYPGIRVVQQTRTGKGNALACGFEACTGDIVVMIDADGSTDPEEIPDFVAALTSGADFAKGSRFRPGGDSHDITRLRRLGNHGLNGIVNILFGTRFTDLCYGYNAFWRDVVPLLGLPSTSTPRPANGDRLWGDGFEIETLINVRVAAHGLSISEVASVEGPRLHGVSNLNAFSDGIRVLRTIIREYRRLRRAPKAAVPAQRTAAGPVAGQPAAGQVEAGQFQAGHGG